MRQHLLIDADDTLWENNVYFERAFDEFVTFLDHSRFDATEIRAILDEIELLNIRTHGYGAENFGRSLCHCYERLVERDVHGDDLQKVMELATTIVSQPIEMIDGVLETIEYLASRHDLTLFTKGHPEEQRLKVDRSGLGVYFGHTEIVREKDAPTYAAFVKERSWEVSRTWMIGNSPKSDINPALEAGLNAVFVPHERTWHLERTVLRPGPGRLLTAPNFAALKRWF